VALYLFSNPKAYPLPNHPANSDDPLGIQGNFVGPSANFTRNDQGDAKIDWQFHTSDKLLSVYSQGYATDGTTADPLPVNFQSRTPTRTISLTLIGANDFVIHGELLHYELWKDSLHQRRQQPTHPNLRLTGNQLVGIREILSRQRVSVLRTSMEQQRRISEWLWNQSIPEIFIDNVFGYSDNFTWQKGRHLMKFGAGLSVISKIASIRKRWELGAFNYNGEYSATPPRLRLNRHALPIRRLSADRVQECRSVR